MVKPEHGGNFPDAVNERGNVNAVSGGGQADSYQYGAEAISCSWKLNLTLADICLRT